MAIIVCVRILEPYTGVIFRLEAMRNLAVVKRIVGASAGVAICRGNYASLHRDRREKF